MVERGPTTERNTERLAGNLLRLARAERGWTQRQLAAAAGVPVSTVARVESGARQPSLVTLQRILHGAGLELWHRLEPYDDHDDVLDARRAAMTDEHRAADDARADRTTAALAAARAAHRSGAA